MAFSKFVKQKLFSIIDLMDSDPSDFVQKPKKDFVRNRKIRFSDVLKCLISLESKSMNQELLRYFSFSDQTPSASAFIQQRKKIKLDAFYHLFYELNKAFEQKKYNGYTLLACDGSDISIPIPKNSDSPYRASRKRKDSQDYYQMCIHALFDLVNQRYLDVILEPSKDANERAALCTMLKRRDLDPDTIIVTDRGYEGYDPLALADSLNLKFVCRAKDGNPGGIVNGFHLPKEGEYDICFDRTYTMRNSKEVKEHPDIYHQVHYNKKSVFLNMQNPDHQMRLRILRIKIGDTYECILTNLSPEEFSLQDIKAIYWMRWGIEISFRELKYTIGLKDFHSKKEEFIEQEVLARMILYNFCQIIIKQIEVPHKDGRKYEYQINISTAITICRELLLSTNPSLDPETLIRKSICPIRPGREYKRQIRFHSAVGFGYRAA